MRKVLAFSGSFSNESINHKLIKFASTLFRNTNVEVIKLTDFEAPIYRNEIEKESGIPESIIRLRAKFDEADGFLFSTPEYNSSLPAGLKNTLDWLSRMEGKIFQDKPVSTMATSPGGRGGQSVLNHLSTVLPFWGAQLVGSFSLPKFHENFSEGKLTSEDLNGQLTTLIRELESQLEQA